jgi:hypothetical protein
MSNIDWSQMETPEDRDAARISEQRDKTSMSRVDFTIAVAGAGLITTAEATAYLQSGTLPAAASSALSAIPEGAQRTEAQLRFIGATEIRRNDPLIDILRTNAGLTHSQLDAIFGIAS